MIESLRVLKTCRKTAIAVRKVALLLSLPLILVLAYHGFQSESSR